MKFKNQISIFLAFFLLLSNIGFAFNVHYCGKDIDSISLNTVISSSNFEKGCCESFSSKRHSCCSDKVFIFKQKSDNLIAKSITSALDYCFLNEVWDSNFSYCSLNFKNSQKSYYCCNVNAPPLFKLYSQYIFYA